MTKPKHPDSFKGYEGRERDFWANHHQRYGDSILAVGRGNASPETNDQEYAVALAQFKRMVWKDLPGDMAHRRVLDLGYGQGHYARACSELGFGEYLGIDFAAPAPRFNRDGYRFQSGDISDPMVGSAKFDLVYCLDVIFHVVDDSKFERALKNMADRAQGWVYITSLFRPYVAPPYVKHRPLEVFSSVLGPPKSVDKWRDNNIARFYVG